jgi:hypothetical protein
MYNGKRTSPERSSQERGVRLLTPPGTQFTCFTSTEEQMLTSRNCEGSLVPKRVLCTSTSSLFSPRPILQKEVKWDVVYSTGIVRDRNPKRILARNSKVDTFSTIGC